MAKRLIDEQALFNTALGEFSQHSFDEASVNKIISGAGIPKGSFYYRFKNKYELYIYLLKESARRKWDFINSDVNTGRKTEPGNDIFDFFMIQAESGVRFAEAYPLYHQLSKMFSKEKGSPLYEKVLKDLESVDDSGLSAIIKKAYEAGNFRNEYSLEFVDKLLKWLFFSFDEILFMNEDFELDKVIKSLKELVNFMKYGLKAPE